MKHLLNITCEVEADSEECARTMAYQALVRPEINNVTFPSAPIKAIREVSHRYPEGFSRGEETTEYWKNQDWANKTVEEISIETGHSCANVRRHRLILFGPQSPYVKRKKRTPETERQTQRKVRREAIAQIDWSRMDADIARSLGITRERVRQYRKRAGIPKPPRPFRYKALAERMKADWDNLSHLRITDIAKRIGEPESIVRYTLTRAQMNKPKYTRLYPWNLFNMKLPNVTLAEIWELSAQAVASYRHNHQLAAPLWRSNGLTDREAFNVESEAERVKAAEWKAKQPHN